MTPDINNIELFKKKFSILQEISNALVVSDNISAISNLMLDLAISYTSAEKGSLMLVNERDELYILAARGIDFRLMKTYRTKIGEGIAGTVAKEQEATLVEDIDTDPRFKEKSRDRYKTRSFISCPIVSKNKLLGVLNINDKKDGSPFSDDEFALMSIIANQAAIALENAFLVSQLRFKAAELENINRKLIESDVAKTEFLARVSHELRTPLNSIKGSIFYLMEADHFSRKEQDEFFNIIASETGKLITIVEDQLDFLRLEDEAMIVNKTIVNLKDLIREIGESKALATLLSRQNIRLVSDVNEEVGDIVGDRVRTAQFFLNILEALSTFCESGDTIRISVRENDVIDVIITLSRKLPEQILPFLFSSSHLFQTEQDEAKLKLYLARKIVELHRWDLQVENTSDAAVISLSIPKGNRQKQESVVNTTIEMFLEFISGLLNINTCSIMLCDELTGDLTIKSAKGLDDALIKQTRIRLGDRIAGMVALEGEPLFIEDIETDSRFGKKSIPQYSTKSLISLPLKIQNKVIGVLNLNNKKSFAAFSREDFQVASVLGERLSYFIERLYSEQHREDDFRQLLNSFDSLINAEKKFHKKSQFLPELIARTMEHLGMSENDQRIGSYIAMVYDLGLSLLDSDILQKKEKLLPTEQNSLKIHPYTTVGLLNSIEFSEVVKSAILHHHERFDGKGYPDGLQGEDIPLLSRILAVVDTYCALITDRPYRKAVSRTEALAELQQEAGLKYDPRVVKSLGEVLAELY